MPSPGPPARRSPPRFFALIPAAAIFGLLGIGFFAGTWFALRGVSRHVRATRKAYTLGRLTTRAAERDKRALAYYEPAEAKRDMDNYAWAPPNLPAPFVGAVPRPGKHFNASINSRAMRADREVVLPKPKGVYRIFLTGGSTAFGSGAPSQERTIGGYLEKLLNEQPQPAERKYELFVMANPSWVTTHERIMIENRLSELQPDMVVSFSGNNDVVFGYLGRNTLWMRAHLDQHYYDALAAVYPRAGGEPFIEMADHPGTPIEPDLMAARLAKNAKLAAHALNLASARYVFALQPAVALSSKPLTSREKEIVAKADAQSKPYVAPAYAAIKRALGAIHDENFAWLDLSDVFHDRPRDEEIFLDSFHFGDRGNELIAKALFEKLQPLLVSSK